MLEVLAVITIAILFLPWPIIEISENDMNYAMLDTICKNLINGNHDDAIKFLQRGCKSKPFEFSSRCFAVQNELLGLGQAGVANRFIRLINRKAETK